MRLTQWPRLLAPITLVVVAVAAGPARADDYDCADLAPDSPVVSADSASAPLVALDVKRAHQIVDGLGFRWPVRVAVVDSGVAQSRQLNVVTHVSFTGQTEVRDYHGTAVAGLIAGRSRRGGQLVGMAPTAEIVDVRVYDTGVPTDNTSVGVDSDRVARGLRWIAKNATKYNIRVANVSLEMPPSPALEAAVAALRRANIVVVAATGNRPSGQGDPLSDRFSEFRPGEDAAKAVFPAGYPGVVGANAASSDPSYDVLQDVLQNSATDVAAPTAGAVSVGLNGSTCVLPSVATSWSTAEVSGLVALLWTAYPGETADQIIARLTETASGSPGVRSSLTGAGIIQPVQAVSRSLHPDRTGALELADPGSAGATRATAPTRAVDPMPELRRTALWWGLLGGAVMTVAVILRPLLRRGRRVAAP